MNLKFIGRLQRGYESPYGWRTTLKAGMVGTLIDGPFEDAGKHYLGVLEFFAPTGERELKRIRLHRLHEFELIV